MEQTPSREAAPSDRRKSAASEKNRASKPARNHPCEKSFDPPPRRLHFARMLLSFPSFNERRGSQVVRPGSAKPLSAGSIPAPASNQVYIRVYGRLGEF